MIASLLGIALMQGVLLDSPDRQVDRGDPAPDTVLTAPAGSLQERWAWAERTVGERFGTFWVGWAVTGDPTGARWYYIDRGVPVRVGSSVVVGSFQMSGSVGGLTFEGVPLAPLTGPRDAHETVILLRYEPFDGRAVLTRVHVGSFAFPVHFDGGALAWLGQGDDAGSVDLIRAAYAGVVDERVQRDLVSAAAAHRSTAAASPALRTWLSDANAPARIRQTAADGLASHGGPDAVGALTTAASRDTSAAVRSSVARALARAAEPRVAVAELSRMAAEDPDRAVRRNAVSALGSIPDRLAFDALVAIVEAPADTAESAIRRSALSTLAQARRPRTPASRPVLDLFARVARTDADGSVRRQAISALISLDDARTTPLLIELAESHADAATRRTALAGLTRAEPRTDALAALRRIAWEHESADTQRAAVSSLARMDGDDVRPLLSEMAESHPRSDVRRSALRAVLELDTRGAGG